MMLIKTRKSNSYFFRFPALALLVVAAMTLLVACGGGSDVVDRIAADIEAEVEILTDTELEILPDTEPEILPDTSSPITTPPPYGGTQEIGFRTEDNKYQRMEIPVSNVPEFSGVAPTGRTYSVMSTDEDVAAATVNSVGVVTVTARMGGSATITVTASGPAASSTLTRSVSAPTTRQDITAEYSFTVDVEAGGGAPAPASEPDLIISSPSASVLALPTGGTFTLSATVENQGTGSSVATTLRYYRSSDSTITTGDTLEGTDPVGVLAASATSAESISLTAPNSVGTYYYGACVDTVSSESNTGNNCSTAVTVKVPVPSSISMELEPPLAESDLIISNIEVSPSTVTTGATFPLDFSVANQGNGSSAATTLRFYRSSDSTITTSDTEVGTYSVSTLAASATSSSGIGSTISLTAPSTSGTYYYGACVDTVTGESDTTNNCSTAVTVTVTAPVPVPDLIVSSILASTYTLTLGTTFTLSATVENQGTGSSAATTLTYYLNVGLSISGDNLQVGTAAVSSLAAFETQEITISLTAPRVSGMYYYGACVVPVSTESYTRNNCSDGVPVTVTEPEPDLIISSISASTYTLPIGATFTLRATVKNQGTGSSARTDLTYYRSTDSTIPTTDDTVVGTEEVRSLAASATSSESISLTAPSSSGTYYYGACVVNIPVFSQSITTSNCSDVVTVTVTAPVPVTAPDLIISARSVSNSSPETSASFTFSATVRNQGTGSSAATTLRYYRSFDSTITIGDTDVGTDSVGILAASATSPEGSITLTAPSSSGTYYYGACVDSVSGESNTGNNCSDGVAVTVEESVIDPSSISASVSGFDGDPGDRFTLSATVRYSGSGTTAPTTVRYYRSSNSLITSSDTQVGTDSISSRSSPTNEGESINIDAPSSSGTYYYGACAETATRTICSSGVAVTVEEPVINPSSISASVSGFDGDPGDRFTLSATVRYSGSGTTAPTTVRYYRSSNSLITSSDTQVGTDSISSRSSPTNEGESINIDAPSSSGTYYYGACAETATTTICSSGVAVTVEEPVINPSSISASVSGFDGDPGDRFTLSATVRYSGSGTTAPTTVRYYRSSNSLITSSDTQVGTDSISSRSSPTNEGESINIDAPSSSGTYYYGACAETATTTICSSGVRVTVTAPASSRPDLVVSVSISASGLYRQSLLNADVENQGGYTSSATTLTWYRSTNSTISTGDEEVGTESVRSLSASGSFSTSIFIDWSRLSGTNYYGACVSPVTNELNTSNNCSRGYRLD